MWADGTRETMTLPDPFPDPSPAPAPPAAGLGPAERALWDLIGALTGAEARGCPAPARGGWCALGIFVAQILAACAIGRHDLAEDAMCEIADVLPDEAFPAFALAFSAIADEARAPRPA